LDRSTEDKRPTYKIHDSDFIIVQNVLLTIVMGAR